MADLDGAEVPSPQLIAETIEHFQTLNDPEYRVALGDNIADPRAEETAAFRSPELAQRSLVQVRHLIQETNNRIARNADESTKAWEARQTHWRTLVGTERRLLEAVVAGLRAQQGIESAAPNPRQRAFRRLAREFPVRYLELVRDEEAKLAEERRLKKEERKAARRRPR